MSWEDRSRCTVCLKANLWRGNRGHVKQSFVGCHGVFLCFHVVCTHQRVVSGGKMSFRDCDASTLPVKGWWRYQQRGEPWVMFLQALLSALRPWHPRRASREKSQSGCSCCILVMSPIRASGKAFVRDPIALSYYPKDSLVRTVGVKNTGVYPCRAPGCVLIVNQHCF